MNTLLGIMAGLILVLYAPYFIRTIQGQPETMELEILRSLSEWMLHKGPACKSYLWGFYWSSLLTEGLYFYLTLTCIPNLAMRFLTAVFILYEISHFLGLGLSLHGFFAGQLRLSQILHWSWERGSAVLFFSHSLLVLAILTSLV